MSAVPSLRDRYRFNRKDHQYIFLRDRWIAEHPNATPREYEEAIRQICKRLGL